MAWAGNDRICFNIIYVDMWMCKVNWIVLLMGFIVFLCGCGLFYLNFNANDQNALYWDVATLTIGVIMMLKSYEKKAKEQER